MALTTGEQDGWPYADLHVKPYAQRHVKVYADTSRAWGRLRAGLTAGDPTGEVAAAWQGKELLRAVYAADDLAHARAALKRF